MGEPAIGVVEGLDRVLEGLVEGAATPDGFEDLERRAAGGGPPGRGQSSIPSVGLDGTAISRLGMRPAR